MDRWQNKVAVVTGASSGIGASIVEKLVKAGLVVVGLARRVELCDNIKNRLDSEQQARLRFKYCDVGDNKSVGEAFEHICKIYGGVDVLVNNAGCARGGLLANMDVKDIQAVVNTNVMGVVYCTQAAVKSMKDREFNGHIFHINSVLGHSVVRTEIGAANIYPATKYAVTAMTDVLRHELNIMKTKIKITSISPGLVNTEIVNDKVKEFNQERILQPDDIAEGILYALGTPPHVQVQELTIRPVGELF
ncbi:DHRS11.2 family protein [Megaselia abdita]